MARLSNASLPSTGKKRGRPAKPRDSTASAANQDDNPRPKKRGRTSTQGPRRTSGAQKKTTAQAGSSKRKRSSLNDVAPSEAQNQLKGRRRTSKGDGAAQASKAPRKSPGSVSKRAADALRGKAPAPRRRSSQFVSSTDDDTNLEISYLQEEEDGLASPERPYMHLESHVRRVKMSTVNAKWNPLPRTSIKSAVNLLQLAQQPILSRLATTPQRQAQTAKALHVITKRVLGQLERGIPFPIRSTNGGADKTGEQVAELDFEAILDGKGALGRQLEPALAAVELLERERARIESELAQDYDALKELEARAKAQSREKRSLLRKAHPLVGEAKLRLSEEDEENKFVFEKEDKVLVNPFKDIKDKAVKGVAMQLGDHVESMSTNLEQVDGIMPQMARSRAALRAVLFEHLDQIQYDKVVLG